MRRALLLCLLLAAGAAQAQPGGGPPNGAPPGGGPPGGGLQGGRGGPPGEMPSIELFISPAGEPFRQANGFAEWFAGADADHDGALTPAEFRADALRFFKVVDVGADGVIDGFDVQRYEARIAPEITMLVLDGARPARGRKAMQLGRQGAARFGLLNTPHPVRAGDLDFDGKVTEAEWVRATAKRFDLLDREKTGKLTMESLRPTPKKR